MIYGLNDGSQPLNYSANDWFYLKTGNSSVCNDSTKEECTDNKKRVQNLNLSTDSLGAAITQYNDTRVLYNRELLFTINIFVGLAMMVYYIYVNGDSLPKLSDTAGKIASAGNSLSTLAASAANKLPAMRPPS